MSSAPRVRFAPSPTGFLHVGGLRTALYNYLYARRHGGVFVLRIEDTDQSRYVPGAVEGLIEALRWAGLTYDEGPGIGGPHEPYLQSQRRALYREAAERMLADGNAYPCFCSPERLEDVRKAQQAAKVPPRYDRTCLTRPASEIQELLRSGAPHVVRMKVPSDETIIVRDIVRGDVAFESNTIDDQVLMKSDGFPTYHLANVVDDHDMRITDVIRGEEWLPSTPKHILLYRFLGHEPPRFAHLPLLLNPDRSKLSKRQGDVAVEDYRANGYLPAALINFVSLLGWSPGDDREFFSLEDLVQLFTLERVNKAGAIFNIEKLKWFNQLYLRKLPAEQLLEMIRPDLEAAGGAAFPDAYHVRVIELLRERVWFAKEFATEGAWFYTDPVAYEEETVAKRWTAGSGALMTKLVPVVEAASPFDHATIEASVRAFAEREGVKTGDIVHPVRLALTGIGRGPGLFELMETLGKETCIRRLRRAVERLGQ